MVFVPLSTTTVAGLSNQEMGNATGLYNLLRNVGGSIGISITNTLLARHSQLHQANLVQNLTPSSRIYQEQLSQGISQLGPKIGTAMAGAGTLGRIYSSLNVQALLLSYVDDFRYLALASFACLPVVLMLRKAVRRKGAVIHAD
jgi:DHA2 family multidrug resistance protein